MSNVSHSTVYTREEVAKHNKTSDCWLVINGKVFDVTKFLLAHPGGQTPMFQCAGKDATAEFTANHSGEILKKYEAKLQIGVIAEGPLNSTNTPASPALASNSNATPLKSNGSKALDASTPVRPPTAGDTELQNYPHGVLSTSAKNRGHYASEIQANGKSSSSAAKSTTKNESTPTTTKKLDPQDPDPPAGVLPLPATQAIQLPDVYGILRLKKIEAISISFYTRVYNDTKTPWLPKMFEGVPMELAINKQWGGNEWYGSMKKDDQFMQAVHSDFRITPNALQRWMEHMRAAIEEVVVDQEVSRAAEVRAVLLDWFWQFGNRTVNTLNNDPKAPQNSPPESELSKKENSSKSAPPPPHAAGAAVAATSSSSAKKFGDGEQTKKEKKPKKEKKAKKDKKEKKEINEKKEKKEEKEKEKEKPKV